MVVVGAQDVVCWDNRTMLHSTEEYDYDHASRHMHLASMKGPPDQQVRAADSLDELVTELTERSQVSLCAAGGDSVAGGASGRGRDGDSRTVVGRG